MLSWILALAMIGLAGQAAAWPFPQAGDQLPAMQLEAPASMDQRAYLGLTAAGGFDPTAIRGRLLIIEMFSMYCPHCQREAPAVNRLYQAIEASDALGGQVKMIGIGVGNSDFEVDHFRKHYQIEFPLFADEDFVIHKQLGEVHTPYFMIVQLGTHRRGTILWAGSGHLDPLETFMDRLTSMAMQR